MFEAAVQDEGVTAAKVLTFSKTDTDFRTLLTEAKAANPTRFVSAHRGCHPLVTQARGSESMCRSSAATGSTTLLMTDAGDAAEGIVGAAELRLRGRVEQGFQEAFEAKFSAKPDQFAAQAYAGMTIIDAAVRAGCSGERATRSATDSRA